MAAGGEENGKVQISKQAQLPPRLSIPMLTVLFRIRRLEDESTTDTLATLDESIESAERCIATPTARDLLGEARVTAAIVRHKN